MTASWVYALGAFVLFLLLVVGIPLFPALLDTVVWGQISVGMLMFVVLHTVPLILAVIYLRARSE